MVLGVSSPQNRQVQRQRNPNETSGCIPAEGRGSKLGRIVVETAVLLSMHNPTDAAQVYGRLHRFTRWTLTPSPQEVVRRNSNLGRKKECQRKKATPKPQPEGWQESGCVTTNQVRNVRAGASKDRLRIFCPAARLPTLYGLTRKSAGAAPGYRPHDGQRRYDRAALDRPEYR